MKTQKKHLSNILKIWQTQDPLGYPDGWNNLAYCGNYPGLAIDPNGALWSWGAVGIGAALGAVGYTLSCAITGENFDTTKLIAAASGGAVAGAIAGTVTGDPSALAIIGIAAGSSLAGKLTENIVNETLEATVSDIDFSWTDLGDGVIVATAFGAAGATVGTSVALRFQSSLTPQTFDDIIAGITGFSIEMSGTIVDMSIDAWNGFTTWIDNLGQERIDNINNALSE